MDFQYPPKVELLQDRLRAFVDSEIAPNNLEWHSTAAAGRYPMDLVDRLKAEAYEEKLWNLFLPALGENEHGTRLTNLEYAPLAEIMGRYFWASEVFNCSAPDTGNMEVLHLFATAQQKHNGSTRCLKVQSARSSASRNRTPLRPTRPI